MLVASSQGRTEEVGRGVRIYSRGSNADSTEASCLYILLEPKQIGSLSVEVTIATLQTEIKEGDLPQGLGSLFGDISRKVRLSLAICRSPKSDLVEADCCNEKVGRSLNMRQNQFGMGVVLLHNLFLCIGLYSVSTTIFPIEL